MDVAKTFAHHAPTEDGLTKIRTLREAYSTLKTAIEETAPPSRERSVSLTELENSAMWAIEAVVINDPESVVDTTGTK